jgi:anti-sigma B factor antagonist
VLMASGMRFEQNPPHFEPGEELLRCEVVPERERARVRPVGALDLATAPALDKQLAELRAAGFRALVLDLRALTFMDSTGLRTVLSWDKAARSDGFTLAIVPGAPQIQRVFELTRTTERVTFIDSG